jgi:hypothetical protein
MDRSVLLPLSVCGYAEQLSVRLRTPSDNNPNDVYSGIVVLPGLQERVRAYVKIFPPAVRMHSVYNEVMAHHIALQCELPSPMTFPCACRVSMLRNGTRSFMVPDDRFPYVLGVASFDGSAKDVTQSVVPSEAVEADVMNWQYAARTAVFDELMANDDRHLGNLVRRGPHDYVLIDNERIVFGEQWFGHDLQPFRSRPCDSNILADTIASGTDELARQRLLMIAQNFVMQTILVVPDVALRLEQLCKAPANTSVKLLEMLNGRRTLLRSLMHYHLRKGDLFQARSNR